MTTTKCDYEECQHAATERRAGMAFCPDHADEHDGMAEVDEIEARLEWLEQRLGAAQRTMVDWFADDAWMIYLAVPPTGVWALHLERTDYTVASTTLRVGSDVREVARRLYELRGSQGWVR